MKLPLSVSIIAFEFIFQKFQRSMGVVARVVNVKIEFAVITEKSTHKIAIKFYTCILIGAGES